MAAESNFKEWDLVDDNGYSILDFTSMISVEIKQEGAVASEPIEEGSFASYNKTGSPLDARVKLGIKGESDALQSFLDRLDELSKASEIFSLVTGEQEYKNLTLESYDFSRKRDDGINSIFADLHIVEIREVSPQYTNAKLPASQCRNKENASKVDTGKTQATAEPEGTLAYNLGLGG